MSGRYLCGLIVVAWFVGAAVVVIGAGLIALAYRGFA